jgi:hypothetical protein
MWTIAHDQASFVSPGLRLAIPYIQPWQGVLFQSYRATTFSTPLALLQAQVRKFISHDAPVEECYRRGHDLVVTYRPTTERQVRIQIYYRAIPGDDLSPAAGVEVIISAQTDLLDVAPTAQTSSLLPSFSLHRIWSFDETLQSFIPLDQQHLHESDSYLVRPLLEDVSYLEMIHPSDFAGVELSTALAHSELHWTLFPERMEKGVIRRSRLCGLLLPQEQDQACALASRHHFVHEPLPLTA